MIRVNFLKALYLNRVTPNSKTVSQLCLELQINIKILGKLRCRYAWYAFSLPKWHNTTNTTKC